MIYIINTCKNEYYPWMSSRIRLVSPSMPYRKLSCLFSVLKTFPQLVSLPLVSPVPFPSVHEQPTREKITKKIGNPRDKQDILSVYNCLGHKPTLALILQTLEHMFLVKLIYAKYVHFIVVNNVGPHHSQV